MAKLLNREERIAETRKMLDMLQEMIDRWIEYPEHVFALKIDMQADPYKIPLSGGPFYKTDSLGTRYTIEIYVANPKEPAKGPTVHIPTNPIIDGYKADMIIVDDIEISAKAAFEQAEFLKNLMKELE